MGSSNSNINIIILLCIFLLVNACNQTIPKIIVEKQNSNKLIKDKNKITTNKDYYAKKAVKKKFGNSKKTALKQLNDNNVVFEFRNERLLQGTDKRKSIQNKKTSKALSAVFKMLKQNLSIDTTNLNLNNTETSSPINYDKNIYNSKLNENYKNILALLPFSGSYSNFGLKIRESLDISILRFGPKDVQIFYLDTGTDNYELNLKNILKTVKPKLIIGPFTRESLLKIKPFAKAESIPVFTFSNDIALIEKNIWSFGFSPEEQIDSIFSCTLRNGSKRFGLIAPKNFYGNIILDRSISLIKTKKDNYFEKLRLSNKQINDKPELFYILKNFLNYKEEVNSTHTKFDTIFLGGSKEFILEIAPLLAFYDVDSRKVQILGTEEFNTSEIKNEPSLEKAWFPMIVSQNTQDLKLIWNESWEDEYDYFTNAGFDAGIIGINYLNQNKTIDVFLKDVKSFINGFTFNANGLLTKPVSVMQIEKLGMLKKIKICNNLD